MELSGKTIVELMDAFAKSGLGKMRIKDGEQEIVFTAPEACAKASPAQIPMSLEMPAAGNLSQGSFSAAEPAGAAADTGAASAEDGGVSAKPAAGTKNGSSGDEGTGTVLTAPLAGVFHRAAKEGDAPIVEPGQKVRKGQTVALMEAMKMVSEVKAPCDGTILEVLAEDGKFCEYREPLMRFGE